MVLQVYAYSVCDDPDYFYDYIQGLLDGMDTNANARDLVNVVDVISHDSHSGFYIFILFNT